MAKRITFLSAALVALAAACYAVIPRKAPYPIWSVAFSPDGKFLAAGSGTVGVEDVSIWGAHKWKGEGAVQVWQTADWKECALFRDGFTTGAASVAFSPDGATLAAGSHRYALESYGSPSYGSWVRFWSVSGWQEQLPVELNHQRGEPGGSIVRIGYAPGGDRLMVGRSGGPSVMMDTKKKALTYRMNLDTSSGFVAFAPDGKTMVGCNRPLPFVRLYQAEDGKPLAVFQTRGSMPVTQVDVALDVPGPNSPRLEEVPVANVQFSVDGALIAAGCDDGTIYLLDSRLQKEVGKLTIAGPARGLAFSPDGRLLAVASKEAVHVFDARSWRPVRTLGEHSGRINDIVFSPDGKMLAAGCGTIEGNTRVTAKGVVRLWDVATGKLIRELE